MNRKLTVGDRAWWANCGTREITEPCPVCFGKRKVLLILGNGEQIETPCDYCGKGLEGPRGVVTEFGWVAEPKIIIVGSVRSEETEGKTKHTYIFLGGYCADSEDLFDTEDEARARCAVRSEEQAEIEKKRKWHMKDQNLRSYSWHVGYHLRCARRAKSELEYHSAKAIICKAKAKEPKP
jgi:hypothetical protein